ncbi:MAG: 2Fe-2S iron-sulfur cluster-binding protein [Sulfuricaulis sp.]|uniref:2Fe-2S iron-sulfur cluster-binding protein n=1 Tax=Sulfuricaulis sp. TaxID=2003553 RepID=UPI0034A14733
MAKILKLKVWRGGRDGAFETYELPRQDSQTILDAVTYVQRRIDPTLSYRFACRVGMCGSCAMTVNGKARWTCRTTVSSVIEEDLLEVAPLCNLPVIKDLVCDMTHFFEKWDETGIPDTNLAFNLTWHDWINLKNLILVSRAITATAIARENSCGAHYRADFPNEAVAERSEYVSVISRDGRFDLARHPVHFTRVRPGESLIKNAAA